MIVLVKNPSDFIGSALGQSEENTRNILANSAGKVLIIDEVCVFPFVSLREDWSVADRIGLRFRRTCCMEAVAAAAHRATRTRMP